MKKVTFILLVIITSVHAQSDSLSLADALKIGLNISSEIQIANSDTLIADAKLTSAWSNLLPKLSVSANYNHLSGMPIEITFPFPTTSNSSALDALYLNATIEQPLFTGFKLSSIKNSALYNKEARLLMNEKEKNAKALEIQKAYWNYYKSLKTIEVLNENLDMILLQKKNVNNFLKIGMATKNDLLKLMVTELEIKSKIVDAENIAAILRANFNRVVGLELNNKTTIKLQKILIEKDELNFDSLLTEALSSREEILANGFMIKAADENISIAKSSWYPQISANASYNYLKLDGSTMLNSDASQFWWIGLGMKWSLWDWWRTSSNVKIAEEKHFQMDVANKMLKEKIELEVYKNFLNVKSQADKIELNSLGVKSAEENYKIVSNKFEQQMATTTEVSEAATILSEAKIRLLNTFIDYKLSQIELNKSVGRKIY